ncbi:MAG: sigma-70 family RNA polymerase sigma factor [Chloroflexi bacterium]|nr:sigma-70 family RNA polymerase sigma factor [Chloroflexota bacterium]
MSTPDVVSRDKAAAGLVDVGLIGRIAAGDAEALGELYDRYGRVVFGVLYRMLGSPEVAEEVTQDAFHSVWRQAGSYRPERGAVRTWLLAIGRNAAIDWRRTRGKRTEREAVIDEAAELFEELRVEDRVLASLRAERIRAAVGTLPVEQRQVLALAFWGGLSQSEIAERTGTPLGTVKSRVRLGMTKLRERLAGEAEQA